MPLPGSSARNSSSEGGPPMAESGTCTENAMVDGVIPGGGLKPSEASCKSIVFRTLYCKLYKYHLWNLPTARGFAKAQPSPWS